MAERHAIQRGGHDVLANTEVEVPTAVVVGLEISRISEREPRFCGWSEIGSAAHQPWDILRQNVQRFARSVASSHAFRVGGEHGKVLIPAVRQFALLHLIERASQIRELLLVVAEQGFPLAAQALSALTDAFAKVFAHTIGHQKFGIFWPAIALFREADFIFAQWLAVSLFRILLIRCTKAYMAMHDNHRGTVVCVLECFQCPCKCFQIIGVRDFLHMPSVA